MDFCCKSALTFENKMFAEVSIVSDSELFMNEFKASSILITEEHL